jgi:AraC-like DNA-binding protein
MNADEIYVVISIFMLGAVLFCLGLCFLFLIVPDRPSLRNYRIARRVMACTYLFFGLADVLEYCFRTFPVDTDYIRLYRTITLVIACPQAFLFTYTLITLIKVNFATAGRIRKELMLVASFVVMNFAVYFTCTDGWFEKCFYVSVLLYVLILMRYTRLFVRHYRVYSSEMSNFFSGQEAKRLRWINFSFYAALAIGVMALLPAMFSSLRLETPLAMVLFFFYTYFAVRFINYPLLFERIEEVVAEPCVVEPSVAERCAVEPCVAECESKEPASLSFSSEFEEKVEKWIFQKRFVQNDISIKDVSEQLATNRRHLSEYINRNKQKNFSEWINDMRINEAKILLLQHPNFTISEISTMTGFNSTSYFGQLFLKATGDTPLVWREKNRDSRNS